MAGYTMNQLSMAIHNANDHRHLMENFLNFRLVPLKNCNIRLVQKHHKYLLQHPLFDIYLEQGSKVPPQQNWLRRVMRRWIHIVLVQTNLLPLIVFQRHPHNWMQEAKR